ncbi:hypothetical protein Stsp01_64430 [Streptomyces sp. NBRC 13847]|uniref:hypothetical protein n=1 Tax=Streptomyces TaxID=1883 RepID=UPI0024A5E282|nr:hypothetical protein [Streptomyces sp. NBRC 13847]GLW19700.1 hypothetical protein Stsp01_64430 [Streptomyces sp. NBRC 13847]
MTTITAFRSRSGRRFSPAEKLFLAHQQQLTEFVSHRAPDADPHTVEDLVQDTWTEALLGGLDTAGAEPGLGADLPQILAQAARVAIYRHLEGRLAEEPAPSGVQAVESPAA